MSLKSCVSTIKIFDPDTDISYGRTFRITVEKVPDNYRPVPPKEAFDVEPEAKENKFGSYYYVDYKLPWRNREKRKA